MVRFTSVEIVYSCNFFFGLHIDLIEMYGLRSNGDFQLSPDPTHIPTYICYYIGIINILNEDNYYGQIALSSSTSSLSLSLDWENFHTVYINQNPTAATGM